MAEPKLRRCGMIPAPPGYYVEFVTPEERWTCDLVGWAWDDYEWDEGGGDFPWREWACTAGMVIDPESASLYSLQLYMSDRNLSSFTLYGPRGPMHERPSRRT